MKSVLLTLFVFLSFHLLSQTDSLRITGFLKIPDTTQYSKSKIVISENGKTIRKIKFTLGKAFEFLLPVYSNTYRVLFTSKKCVSKYILVNSSNVIQDDIYNGEVPIHFEMTLFEKCKKSKFKFLKQIAVGEYSYDPVTGYMQYDVKKAKEIRNRIQKELEKCKTSWL